MYIIYLDMEVTENILQKFFVSETAKKLGKASHLSNATFLYHS